MKIAIVAAGKMRGADAELCAEYQKRLGGAVTVREIVAANQKAECAAILKAIPKESFAVLLDERGKDLSSRELASILPLWQERAGGVAFVIGGADGVTEDVRKRADFTLSFGRKTWPHRLVRVMLLEQIYRAAQIGAGHPYHRE